ncbi:MAG: TlpA family protein disulfide reductase [Ignavibacteria bacterium]|nr:TlpA family protein disulfide reductase [Ignavibacteria bacterium]
MTKLFCLFLILFSIEVHPQQIKKIKIKDVLNLIDTSTIPIVINFWASWCKPCIEEIPYFEKEVLNFKEQKVSLILVNLDFPEDYPKHITNFVKKNNYKSKVYWLNETNADYFCPLIDSSWTGAIPVTVMLNNKKGFRKFYNSKIPENKIKSALSELVAE